MSEPSGGKRDRMIIESFFQMLKTNMTALGWFDANRQHQQMSMRPGPVAASDEIPYNTLVVCFEDIDPIDMELGSNATEITHTAYVDFYGEPGPPEGNGGEALGKHVIGDVWAIIVGQMPSLSRTAPTLEVLDYSLATPTYLFTVEFDTQRTKTSKPRHYNQPWERYWYTCVVELIEERDDILIYAPPTPPPAPPPPEYEIDGGEP